MQSQGGHLKETKMEVQKWVLKSSQQHLQPSLWLFPVWQFLHQQLKPLLAITMTTPHSLLLLAIGEDPIPQVVQKTDTSGTYIIANTICNGGFDVYVDGHDSSAGEWVDCTDKTTRGQPHLKTTNNPGLISQWVYENGYRTARLGGYKWGSNRSATGLWSPDSAGSYRYLGSTT